MPLFYKKSAFVGLSIHDDEIRLIKLKGIKRRIIVDDAAITKLPTGLFSEGKITDVKQATSLIKELVNKTQSERCESAIALPISQVMHKRIALAAHLSERETAIEIAENLSHYLPAVQTELHYDHIYLDQLDAKHQDIMLVAARSEQINGYLEVVKQAGLAVTVIDADVYALARSLFFLNPVEDKIALVDVDVASMQVIVLQQKKILFHQRVALRFMSDVAALLSQTLQLYSVTSQLFAIEKTYLAGKVNLLPIQESIQSTLSIRVDILTLENIIEWPQPHLQTHASHFLTALGLALRGLKK